MTHVTAILEASAPILESGEDYIRIPSRLFPHATHLDAISALSVTFGDTNDDIDSCLQKMSVPKSTNPFKDRKTFLGVAESILQLSCSEDHIDRSTNGKPPKAFHNSVPIDNFYQNYKPQNLTQLLKNLVDPDKYQNDAWQTLVAEGILFQCGYIPISHLCGSDPVKNECFEDIFPTTKQLEARLSTNIKFFQNALKTPALSPKHTLDLKALLWWFQFKRFILQYRQCAHDVDADGKNQKFMKSYVEMENPNAFLTSSIIPKAYIDSAQFIMKLLRFIGPKKGQRDAWFKNGEVYPLKDQTRLGKFIDHVVRTFSTASSPEKPTSFKTLLHMASPFGWNFPEAQYVLGLYLHSIEEWKMAGYFISLASDAGIKSAKWMCHLIQRRSAYSKTYGLELSANQSTSLLASSLNLIGDVPVSLLDYLRKVQVIGNAIIALKDAERNYCHVETPATRPKREVYDLDFRSIYQRIDPTKLEEVLHNKNFIPSIKDMKLINKIRVVALNLHSLLEEIKPLAQELRCKLQVDRSNFKHAEITLRIKRLDEILGSPEQSSTTDQQNQSIFALLKQKNHRGFP